MLSGDPGPRLIFSIRTASYGENPDKSHEAREFLTELEILDAIIATHNSLRHAGQNATAKMLVSLIMV